MSYPTPTRCYSYCQRCNRKQQHGHHIVYCAGHHLERAHEPGYFCRVCHRAARVA